MCARSLVSTSPVTQQFVIYVKQLLSGDLGQSLRTRRPVLGDIALFLPATLELGIAALLMSIMIGVRLACSRRSTRMALSIRQRVSCRWPAFRCRWFWFGLALILLFYVKIPILPGSGRITLGIAAPPRFTASS